MSIPVDLDRLAETLDDFGSGYLLTVSPRATVKALAVDPIVENGLIRLAGTSHGSAANLEANPNATVIFPPLKPRGFTLIVDGTARAVGGGFEVSPAAAVLHRPAAHADASQSR